MNDHMPAAAENIDNLVTTTQLMINDQIVAAVTQERARCERLALNMANGRLGNGGATALHAFVQALRTRAQVSERDGRGAATTPPAIEVSQQHDDLAVDLFASTMKAKMATSREKGRGGWDDPGQCDVEDLAAAMVQHVVKGDPVDIANFCMMIWNRVRETGPDTYAPIVDAFRAYAAAPAVPVRNDRSAP